MPVYKDKTRGTWYYQAYVKLDDGTVKQPRKRGFKTKKEAQIAEMKAVEEIKNFREEEKKLTFEAVSNEYMEWHSARRKVSSVIKIKSLFVSQLVPYFGQVPIDEVTPGMIMDHQTKMMEKYSGNYISVMHSVLSNFFKYAVKKGYITDNPAKTAGGPDVKRSKIINYWTLEEFKEFLKVVDDPLYYALFMTLYYSGMRKGELLALTWADINFDTSEINVNKTVYKTNVHSPKTPSSIRMIGMPSFVMSLLKKLKLEREPDPSEGHRVFGDFHRNISETYLAKRYKQYLSRTDVKPIRIHDFRHSHASYLINRGTVVSVVASRLGHGDIASTLNIYSHLYPSTEREAVLAMEDDFKPVKILKILS